MNDEKSVAFLTDVFDMLVLNPLYNIFGSDMNAAFFKFIKLKKCLSFENIMIKEAFAPQ